MKPEQREELKQAAKEAERKSLAGEREFKRLANPAAILSLIAQVEALTVPQWVKTDDRLPELDVQVLAIRNGCLGIGGRYARANGGIGYRFNNTTSSGDLMKFECWMHAPTIPAIPGTKEGA